MVPAAVHEEYNLYVDLTRRISGVFEWEGYEALIEEPTSSNWAIGHPDVSIGNCVVMSAVQRFKLVSVDCASLQETLCIGTLK